MHTYYSSLPELCESMLLSRRELSTKFSMRLSSAVRILATWRVGLSLLLCILRLREMAAGQNWHCWQKIIFRQTIYRSTPTPRLLQTRMVGLHWKIGDLQWFIGLYGYIWPLRSSQAKTLRTQQTFGQCTKNKAVSEEVMRVRVVLERGSEEFIRTQSRILPVCTNWRFFVSE